MDQSKSLKEVVDMVLENQKEVYQDKNSPTKNFKLYCSRVMCESDNLKDIVFPFIRMTSLDKQLRQRLFFMGQTTITSRKVVEHILQMIFCKQFSDNDIVILLKCISFKYLQDDVYEFVYQPGSNLIEKQIAYQMLQPQEAINSFDKLIQLWLQTMDIPQDSQTRLLIQIRAEILLMINSEQNPKVHQKVLISYQVIENYISNSKLKEGQHNSEQKKPTIIPQSSQNERSKKIKIQSCKEHYNFLQVQEEPSLKLNPDQSIIKTVFSSRRIILSDNSNEIFYNTAKQVFMIHNSVNLPKHKTQLKYKGQLNRLELPHITGEIYYGRSIIFSGYFQNGLIHGKGQFQDVDKKLIARGTFVNNQLHGPNNIEISTQGPYYIQGKFEYGQCRQPKLIKLEDIGKISQISLKNEEETRLSTYLFYIKDISINNYQFNSLREGFWVNQSVIDQHVIQVFSDYNLINQVKKQEQYLLITTNMFQDIFSSMITEKVEIAYDSFKQFLIIQGFDKIQPKRIIFLLNYDRSHFVLFLYEEQGLLFIDSLQGNPYQILTKKLIDLLTKFNFKLKTNILTKVNVSQQENGYDCGIYALYYACQLIKHQNLPIVERCKQMKVQQRYINQYRQHVAKCLFGNYAQL